MMTFLEFYDIFMKFVLFKMYSDVGLAYVPSPVIANRDHTRVLFVGL